MTNNSRQEHFEVNFTGNNIRPDEVKVGDIAEILNAIETLVELRVSQTHPEIKKEQVIIGLTNIRSESIDLEFRSPLPEVALAAFEDIGQGINLKDFSQLHSGSYKAFNIIATFARLPEIQSDIEPVVAGVQRKPP